MVVRSILRSAPLRCCRFQALASVVAEGTCPALVDLSDEVEGARLCSTVVGFMCVAVSVHGWLATITRYVRSEAKSKNSHLIHDIHGPEYYSLGLRIVFFERKFTVALVHPLDNGVVYELRCELIVNLLDSQMEAPLEYSIPHLKGAFMLGLLRACR